jgi:hypothetical protein
MREFKYKGEMVGVDYSTFDDGDKEYHPEIIIDGVYYLGVNILPVMSQADEIELKGEMYDQLFN